MLLDKLRPQLAFGPLDLSLGANVGEYVSFKSYGRIVVMLVTGVGTAGQDPILTLTQAKNNAGLSAKALTFTTIYSMQGADLTVIGTFTKVTQAAANTYTNGTAAENETLWLVEIASTDLDTANGFTDLKMSVADVGANAQLGCGMYWLGEPKLRTGLEFLIDPTTD